MTSSHLAQLKVLNVGKNNLSGFGLRTLPNSNLLHLKQLNLSENWLNLAKNNLGKSIHLLAKAEIPQLAHLLLSKL